MSKKFQEPGFSMTFDAQGQALIVESASTVIENKPGQRVQSRHRAYFIVDQEELDLAAARLGYIRGPNSDPAAVAQWIELTSRAENFGLSVAFNSTSFILTEGDHTIGRYPSFFDLREGLSNWAERARVSGAKF